ARSSCSTSSRLSASAPARPARTRYRENVMMRKILMLLALCGSFALAVPAFADEAKPADAPAAAAATAAAPAAAPAPVPNKGDTAWMIVATVLVILMTIPGLALFYGGMVRAKNMLSVLMQVFATFSLLAILWAIYGYSIAFTEGGQFFGGFSRAFLSGVTP